jgi:uncharacterized protein
MVSLSDKLKSLGVQLGAQDTPLKRRSERYPIEQVIEGTILDTPMGQAYVVESHYPLDYQQGSSGLRLTSPLKTIADWCGDQRLLECAEDGFVFLDTETSGLAGGTGTYAFLIGVGRLDSQGFRLAQFFMRDPIEEAAQLAALTRFIHPCQGLVTFNGKTFDVPILNARFITNGDTFPLKSAVHLDLLPLARRLWRDRLPDRSLGNLEIQILGANRTEDDVPGWMIPGLYFDYLRTGDARPLRSVFYHNAMDILSLAALLNHMAALITDPFKQPVLDGIDLIALGKLNEDLGNIDEAAKLYARGLDAPLPDENRRAALERWSFMEKRRGNYSLAIELWRQAVDVKAVFACVELAKYYEHRLKDVPQAIHWTQKAFELLNSPDTPPTFHWKWLAELEHRLNRLSRKLNSAEK